MIRFGADQEYTKQTASVSTFTKVTTPTATYDPFVNVEGTLYGEEDYNTRLYAALTFFIGRK